MCRGFWPACCLLFTSARPFRTLPGRPRPPRQAITSIDSALGRLWPLTSRVIVLAVDHHSILVFSDDDQLPSFAKTHVSDALNGASSSPDRTVGELAGKAIGSHRHETRRDEATLARPSTGVLKEAPSLGALLRHVQCLEAGK